MMRYQTGGTCRYSTGRLASFGFHRIRKAREDQKHLIGYCIACRTQRISPSWFKFGSGVDKFNVGFGWLGLY